MKRSQRETEDDDDMDTRSVETTPAGNGNKAEVAQTFATYLLIQAEVPASKKGTDTMKKHLTNIYKTIKEADDSAAFSIYKSESEYGSDKKSINK